MSEEKKYRVRILDIKYLCAYEQLNFCYFTYEVKACNENEAVDTAKSNYMKGINPMLCEELPFLLKLYSVNDVLE